MTSVGSVFVEIKPVVRDFRGEVARGVDASLGRSPIAVPITPTITKGSAALSWERMAGGAVIPVPITPTITPAAKAALGSEIGGLRGLLLGGGQFAASRALGISGAAAGLFLFGTAAIGAVKSAATLEQELNVFQQVSGATAEQMKRVRAEARALGADISLPAVSAGDAAATMTELAKAGLSVGDVLKGTRGTLQLAAAANLDFATSSELVANALNAFQRPGSEAVKVADLLAGAANAAQGDIADFGVGLAQSAAVAHQAGIPLGETVTFLTELAKAGIQGSDAGTSLRTTLLRLIAPTGQASKIFRELGIEITDAAGNVRTDVFEQLRTSLQRLEPATRNAALATIFGSDAVRAASVFVRDGAEGHARIAQQVERQGQAAETAAARTKGLSGTVSALNSNVQTLGTDLGTLAIPLLTGLGQIANQVVGDLDKVVVEVTKVGEALAGIKLGPAGTLGDIVSRNLKNAILTPFQPLHVGIDVMRGDFRGAAGDAEKLVPGLHELRTTIQGLASDASKPLPVLQLEPPGGSALEQLLKGPRSGEDVAHAAAAGGEIGTLFGRGLTSGIVASHGAAVQAAQSTVRDAQRSLREILHAGESAVNQTIIRGQQAVAAAAAEAKINLSSIALGLEQQVLTILDHGPLAKRIQALRAELTAEEKADEKKRLERDVRDAKAALKRAQAAVQPAPGEVLSPEEQKGIADFLRPFKERLDDATAALAHFQKSSKLDKLTGHLDEQKAKLQQSLDDVIARFNAGLSAAPNTLNQVAQILQKNVGPMKTAGKAQGFAFQQAFQAELKGLREQIIAITVGPKTGKTGKEPRVVSPAQVAAQAAADVRGARTDASRQQVQASVQLKDAVTTLRKEQHKDIAGAGNSVVGLLQKIHEDLGGKASPHKPSSSVTHPKRGPRTGGR